MGRVKREMALRVAATAITNLSDPDASKFAEMLKIGLWYPDLHASKNERYPLPQIAIRATNSQTAAEIAEKCWISSNKWVKKRIFVRAFLERMMSYLKSTKRKKAEIALEMLNVADAKLDGWKHGLNDLADRFREVE